jgi:hypothetical protein
MHLDDGPPVADPPRLRNLPLGLLRSGLQEPALSVLAQYTQDKRVAVITLAHSTDVIVASGYAGSGQPERVPGPGKAM